MQQPAVTILTPVFNRAGFLPQLFRCVDNQIFQDFEHVIVDDRSSDDGPAILQARAQTHARTRVFVNGYKKGVSGARNFGLDQATGKYVALLDSDDSWTEDHLQAAIGFLEQHPEVAFYFANRLTVDQNDTVVDTFFETIRSVHEMPVQEFEGGFRIAKQAPLKIFLKGNPVTTSSVIVRRSMLGDVRFDDSLRLVEDRDFWIRVAMESGGKIAFRMTPSVRYMRHAGSTMSHGHTFGVRWMAAQLALYDRWARRYMLDSEEKQICKSQRRQIRSKYAYHLWHNGQRLRGLKEYVQSRL